MQVNDVARKVLVDSGCSRCLVHVSACGSWRPSDVGIVTMDGARHRCLGVSTVCVKTELGSPKFIEAFVIDFRPLNYDFVLGMNGVKALGGVCIGADGEVTFSDGGTKHRSIVGVPAGGLMEEALVEARESAGGDTVDAAASVVTADNRDITVEEADFRVTFDARKRQWTVMWKWSGDGKPDDLKNSVGEYTVKPAVRVEYEREIEDWMNRGWLCKYDERVLGPPKGLIPLMAVIQKNKGKVRPVLDFRELNEHIEPFTAKADVCADKMREWKKKGSNVALVDLSKAYLQIAVHEDLWPFQTVEYHGQRLCLTRLGFGMNIAPSIMKTVLNAALSQDPDVFSGTSSYIDDIYVNEDVISAEAVRAHLMRFGLMCKPPEKLASGARVLGMHVEKSDGKLRWRRDNDFGTVPEKLTRRSVFSLCGKLVGHLPVCGWLRVAAAYIKRRANAVTHGWDDPVQDDGSIRRMLKEVVRQVHSSDPAGGRWDVAGDVMTVWTDASSLALGVALEVDGEVIEDASWLRTEDATHINLAELDATLKGINLALAWNTRTIRLLTDSRTVFHWIKDALSGRARLKTKASSEMLIRRRVSLLTALVTEYQLNVSVEFVTSSCNKADALTRVPQEWLKPRSGTSEAACGAQADSAEALVKAVHESCGHPGIRRTLYFVRKRDSTMTRQQVRAVVSACEECKSIDPAPLKWKHGCLSVEDGWHRLAVDVAHVGTSHYLTMVDCGPSRFCVWRKLHRQDSHCICEQLESVFFERGAPAELLLDNATVFRGQQFQQLLRRWGVRARYRCAFEAGGNGIAERSHRTVKTAVARSRCSVEEAVYWYNMTPKDSSNEDTAPASRTYRYSIRVRPINIPTETAPQTAVPRSGHQSYALGDAVWVRRRGSRCFARSRYGTVTAIISDLSIEVDGIPHHVRNLRPCWRQRTDLPQRQDRHRRAEDDGPLLVRLPPSATVQLEGVSQRSPLPESETPAAHPSRAPFTLPSRSTVRCLRVNPLPRRP